MCRNVRCRRRIDRDARCARRGSGGGRAPPRRSGRRTPSAREEAERRRQELAEQRAREVEEHEKQEAERRARLAEARESEQRARREALARLHNLLGRVEPLIARTDLSLKAADRALRDVRTALNAIPPLPSRQDFEEVARRLRAAQDGLTPKVHELREAEDWQRWANVGVQEQLIAKMEALKALDDAETIAREVRSLQEQWKKVADVPRPQADALWRRFKTAHDEVWTKCEAHFAVEAQVRAENLARKIALCEKAEALAESTNWIQTAEEIKRLQAEWKAIGPVSRGREKAIWDRFRTACDRFFTRRHDDLAQRKKTVGREPREEGRAVRPRGDAVRFVRLGAGRRRDSAAAGRLEGDRTGQEEPIGSRLAALPCGLRQVLHALRAAPRHRARRARRRPRGDLRRDGGARGFADRIGFGFGDASGPAGRIESGFGDAGA